MSIKVEGPNMGFGGVLFLIFLVLKLVGVIHWSWWWITVPLWGPLVLTLVIFGFLVLLSAIAEALK